MKQLAGKIAVVYGAGSGIGAAIAELFHEEGATVALVGRTESSLEATRRACADGAPVSTHVADVADAAAVETVTNGIAFEHGGIDIVVNSAGILDETPVIEMTPEVWDRTIAVDLTGSFNTARYAVPHLIARGGGRIINVGSQLGIKGGTGLAHYVSAKAGVIGLGKALALELAPHGILVNTIAPGPIETPLIGGLSDEWKRRKRDELPIGRFGTPEEVAPTALLLASSPGGDLYTGQTLGPNSGDVMP
ncbi:SDR family NAD(P)-dependent oxidoreductase [Leucobacter celer]|uniref:SDR family NAD(P)-dependent oxidoreductase n=1 Tax=Leucobacter celer TaxID=668625 RepID=UPI0006A76F8F|nr:SDR family NAD(P)-dependent oxidoreductase [Leucobacter celer]